MKEMIKSVEAASNAAPAAPAPSPTPYYTPPPPPTNIPPMPSPGSEISTLEDGGDVGGSKGSAIKDFFNGINGLDVAISAFIIAWGLYAIQYYKFLMMLEKTGYADLSSRVQKLESASTAKKQTEMNASGGRNTRKRSIVTL